MSRYTFLLLIFIISCQSSKEVDTWKVYYFGGQSNMDGYGHNSKLPDSLKKVIPNSMIFNGNRDNQGTPKGGIGIWASVEPGHGYLFETNGISNTLSGLFGSELSFANAMIKNGEKIAIIKYSFGGTSLYPGAGYGDWNPDQMRRNHYDNALSTIKNAYEIADINGDGRLDELIPHGIIWMQGESDGGRGLAPAYEKSFLRMLNRIKKDLERKDVAFVIGRINDSRMSDPNWTAMRKVQVKLAENTEHGEWIDTDDLSEPENGVHFPKESYPILGSRFAQKAITLIRKKSERK